MESKYESLWVYSRKNPKFKYALNLHSIWDELSILQPTQIHLIFFDKQDPLSLFRLNYKSTAWRTARD